MRKLKHDIKVGDRFFLDPPGWQCADVTRGEYEVVEISEENYDGCKIEQVNGDATYYMRLRNIKYFCGEEIEHEYGVAYDSEDYQPSLDDEDDPDFIIEDEGDEIGFWYLASRGDNQCIISSMLQSRFAWVKMPW